MSFSLPRRRRVTALLAVAAVTAGGLLVATRTGAAPEPDYGPALRSQFAAGTVPGLDPSLHQVAGRPLPGRRLDTSAAPDRDRAGRVVVEVTGDDTAALQRAVTTAGGVVQGAVPGRVQAAVPAASLAALAGAAGVRSVDQARAARPHAYTSEGVALSGSADWQAAGADGAGVTIGIVDVGFARLDQAIARGELPAGTVVKPAGDFCPGEDDPNFDYHGTNVAMIVHDMAPAAKLVLSCARYELDFAKAADYFAAEGVQVANASIGFPAASRGDGSGVRGSPSDTVRRSRTQAGILWVASAGNEAQSHWSAGVGDADRDGWLEFAGSDESQEITSTDSEIVTLQWDAWPRTTTDLDLFLMREDRAPTGINDPALALYSARDQAGTPEGAEPWEAVALDPGRWYLYVGIFRAPAGLRYDLTYYGATGERNRAAGSIADPASSQYAVAVGAACHENGQLEPFSSQGPTIDGRTKPDITGYDGVGLESRAGTCATGFAGTSASAPNVAGAAAQLLGENPRLDAAELQAQLEGRAAPAGPPGKDDQYGAGLLRLGTPGTPQAPAGEVYTALPAPVRVLDTRTTTGGHRGPVAAREEVRLPLRGTAGVPADAGAVVLNVTGTGPTTGTYVSVYPTTFPGTSSLNLATGETAANLVTATLAADGSTVLRNNTGTVNLIADVVGFYRPTGGQTFVARSAPARILDTRTAVGGHRGPLKAGEAYPLPVRGVAGVPAEATAVALTVTGTNGTAPSTFLAVYPTTWGGTSTLNLTARAVRSNLAITGIGADGRVRIRNNSGTTHVVADLAGWYVPTGGGRYVPLAAPTRYLDTRTGTGLVRGRIGPAQVATARVAGVGSVPFDASALVANLTGTAATATSYLSAYPAGTAWPGTSTLSLPVGRTVPDAVQLRVGTAGSVAVRNATGGAHAILDVSGYFTAAG